MAHPRERPVVRGAQYRSLRRLLQRLELECVGPGGGDESTAQAVGRTAVLGPAGLASINSSTSFIRPPAAPVLREDTLTCSDLETLGVAPASHEPRHRHTAVRLGRARHAHRITRAIRRRVRQQTPFNADPPPGAAAWRRRRKRRRVGRPGAAGGSEAHADLEELEDLAFGRGGAGTGEEDGEEEDRSNSDSNSDSDSISDSEDEEGGGSRSGESAGGGGEEARAQGTMSTDEGGLNATQRLEDLLFTIPLMFARRGMARSEAQKRAHMAYIGAVLPRLFGNEFPAHRDRLLEHLPIESTKEQAAIIAPRRFGKTVALASFVAGVAWCLPGISKISIFSLGQRQATWVLDKIVQFLQCMPGWKERIVSQSAERIQIRSPNWATGDSRIVEICSYPCTSNAMRGVDSDMVILEEGNFIPAEFMKDVVHALQRVAHTITLAISTLTDPDTHFTKMLTARSELTGDTYFHVDHIRLICDACTARGIKTECPHRRNLRPRWISGWRDAMCKAFMNDDNVFEAEAMGGFRSQVTRAFPFEVVERLSRRSLCDFSHATTTPNTMFLVIDPNAGGRSDMGILALTPTPGTMFNDGLCAFTVVGLRGFPCATIDENNENIRAMVQGLATHIPQLCHMNVVAVIEANNCGLIANGCGRVLMEALYDKFKSRVSILRDQGTQSRRGQQYGVYTTSDIKTQAQLDLNTLLTRNAITFHRAMSTGSPEETGVTRRRARDKLVRQLHGFQKIVSYSGGRTRTALSGKASEAANDDMVMALMLGVYWSKHWLGLHSSQRASWL